MALSLADLCGPLGWAVVVKGVAVRSLAPGEDPAAVTCGLCSPSALTRSCAPWVVLDGTTGIPPATKKMI